MTSVKNYYVIVSPKEVLKEIEKGDDHLKEWSKKQTKLFKDLTVKQIKIVQEILAKYPKWLNEDSLTPIADPFVIACAKIKNGTVVTEEQLKPNAAKIPNVCAHFNVPCIDLERFMQQQGWTF